MGRIWTAIKRSLKRDLLPSRLAPPTETWKCPACGSEVELASARHGPYYLRPSDQEIVATCSRQHGLHGKRAKFKQPPFS